MGNRPAWNKYTIDVNDYGQKRVRGLVCFIIMTPKNVPIFHFARRKMKDACMAFEKERGMDWEDAVSSGFSVLKVFGTGVCRNDDSLRSINDWVELVNEGEEAA